MKKGLLLLILSMMFSTLSAQDTLYRLTHFDDFSLDRATRLEELKQLSADFEMRYPFEMSDVAVDILIPIIAKDLDMLPHAITYAKRYLLHPIRDIYLVAPQDPSIIAAAQQLGCIFVDEATVLPIQIADIDYFPSGCNGCDRRSWLFQQFLKLNCDHICNEEFVLILDADTLLTRPQCYISQNRVIFNCSAEFHPAYRETYQRLIQKEAKGPFSFICHTALFEKSKIKHFKEYIETLHQKPWYQAIMDCMDKEETSSFAEYESYSQFVATFYPDSFIQLYCFNDSQVVRRKHLKKYLKGKLSLDPYTKSISFHHYNH